LGISPAHLQGIVIGDFQSLIVFVALVAAALHFRHRPASHKRLMLLSCFAIYGPVHSRLEQLGLHLSWELLLGGFLLSLVMYDLMSAGRVHRATTWGGLLVLVGDLAGLALVGTTAGGSIVDSLR